MFRERIRQAFCRHRYSAAQWTCHFDGGDFVYGNVCTKCGKEVLCRIPEKYIFPKNFSKTKRPFVAGGEF